MRDETLVTAMRFGFGLPLPEGTPVGRAPMLAALELLALLPQIMCMCWPNPP